MDVTRLSGKPVLLFDGECGLCQALMRFLLKRDTHRKLAVAPLQGEVGQALLRRVGLPTTEFDSLVFFPDYSRNEFVLRTEGVVAVLQLLPSGWARCGRILGGLPVGIRDAGYRVVAKFRHALFGDATADGLSDPAIADRVLP
ncbi:MAG: DCC1-like thiol-disulfide oxidoreductase family protein [Synoicihabitans sp.]